MIKHVIFDFDGTIVDSRALIVKFYNEFASSNGYKEIKLEEIEHLSTMSIPDRCKLLEIPLYTIPKMALNAKKKYREAIPTLKAFEGIGDLIRVMKSAGLDISIISSNGFYNIKTFLQYNDLDIFDNIFSSRNLFGKQYKINSFLKNFNLAKGDVIYIGDELRDIVACRKSGVKIISVSWGWDSGQLLFANNPDFLANKPSEILGAIKSLSS